MQRVLSTYRYVKQQLDGSLLSEIAQVGIKKIEIFCATSHFDYRSPQAIRELGDFFGEHHLELHALHSPTERNMATGRDTGVPISIADTERIRRIDAVDEVKRAIEVAERIPFTYLVQHMGHSRDALDPRKLDAAFNSLEHLAIFAKERGVTIALENTPSELGAPETLLQFIKDTHLNDLKLCFDIGHAHMEAGVGPSFELMRDRIVTTHIHDNHGEKDEHLLPYEGTIDWNAALALLAGAPSALPVVLELKQQPSAGPTLDQVQASFDRLEVNLGASRANSAHL